jgi:hypothetical protein
MSFVLSILLAAPPTVVVVPLKVVSAEADHGTILSGEIRTAVGRSKSYKLVTPGEMAAIDEELSRQLSGGCDEASCVAELGGALGATFLIAGQLATLGSKHLLQLKLVEIETVTAVRSVSINAASVEALLPLISDAVADLLGEAKKPASTSSYAALLRADMTNGFGSSLGLRWKAHSRVEVSATAGMGMGTGDELAFVLTYGGQVTLRAAGSFDQGIHAGLGGVALGAFGVGGAPSPTPSPTPSRDGEGTSSPSAAAPNEVGGLRVGGGLAAGYRYRMPSNRLMTLDVDGLVGVTQKLGSGKIETGLMRVSAGVGYAF